MRTAALLILSVASAGALAAQDPFEIHVYEYEPMKHGEYSLEAHLNLIGGNAVHLTMEPTIGFAESFALGFMFLSGRNEGGMAQFGGWRVLPHLYAPESWHLPVRVGFVAEFSFQKEAFEENTRRVELRPILDKEFGRWQLVFNPVIERALHGPGVRHGWNFEPALLLRWKRKRFSPSLEYYGEIESINVTPRGQPSVHQLFAGGDWQVKPEFLINVGTGFDLGPRGPGIVTKSRFEWHWGGSKN